MWREASPRGAIADIRTVYDQAGKHRWSIAILSGLATFGLFSVMVSQSWKKGRELPEIIYINSWPADRTAAETKAFVEENQRRKQEARARTQAPPVRRTPTTRVRTVREPRSDAASGHGRSGRGSDAYGWRSALYPRPSVPDPVPRSLRP